MQSYDQILQYGSSGLRITFYLFIFFVDRGQATVSKS